MMKSIIYFSRLDGYFLKGIVGKTDDSLTFFLEHNEKNEDAFLKIEDDHERECCENVYADWDYLTKTALGKLNSLFKLEEHKQKTARVKLLQQEENALREAKHFQAAEALREEWLKALVWVEPLETPMLNYILIQKEIDMGLVFTLGFETKKEKKQTTSFFIPAYNEQNGYYSDNLTVTITSDIGIDVSNATCFREA